MNNAGERYVPQSFFNGSVTLAALYVVLREQAPPIPVACHLLHDLIRADNVSTEPNLQAPTEIRPYDDGKTIAIFTRKQTYAGEDVRVFCDPKTEPPPVRRTPPGVRDNWDWEAAMIYLYNLCLRARAERLEEPDGVSELRVFFERRGGAQPSDRTLERRVAAWRGQRWWAGSGPPTAPAG